MAFCAVFRYPRMKQHKLPICCATPLLAPVVTAFVRVGRYLRIKCDLVVALFRNSAYAVQAIRVSILEVLESTRLSHASPELSGWWNVANVMLFSRSTFTSSFSRASQRTETGGMVVGDIRWQCCVGQLMHHAMDTRPQALKHATPLSNPAAPLPTPS